MGSYSLHWGRGRGFLGWGTSSHQQAGEEEEPRSDWGGAAPASWSWSDSRKAGQDHHRQPSWVPTNTLAHFRLLNGTVVASATADPEAHPRPDPAPPNSGTTTALAGGQILVTKQLPLGASGHSRYYLCGFLFMIFIKNKQCSIRTFSTAWLLWGPQFPHL